MTSPDTADQPDTWFEFETAPFTDVERAAIRTYEQRIAGIPDTLDVIDFSPEGLPVGLTADDTRAEIRSYFDMSSSWYCALDSLRSDLSDETELLTVAGVRYITHECNTWYRLLNLVRREACRWAFGTAGPQPEVDAGHLTFFASPGIQLDGTIAAESQ